METKTSSFKNGLLSGAIGITSLLIIATPISNNNVIDSLYTRNTIDAILFSNDENNEITVTTTVNQENSGIMYMTNDELEVEDLAERITQAQLNEIKSHFDTKIANLDTNIKLHIDQQIQNSTSELKSFIAAQKDEEKTNKKESLRFWLGSILIPIISVVATLFATKYFGLY